MATKTMATKTAEVDILDFLVGKEECHSIQALRKTCYEMRQQLAKYGDLEAERQSAKVLREQIKTKIRQVWLLGKGRRIDLLSILEMKKKDGKPLWSLLDPTMEIGWTPDSSSYGNGARYNANCFIAGTASVQPAGVDGYDTALHRVSVKSSNDYGTYMPTGIPPLPKKARDIFDNNSLQRRAKWMGLLFQPDEWRVTKPDPAIIAEWHDLPGEYYILAVWGGDRPRIMEFVS